MFLIIGVVISFFLSGLLFLKKHKSRADKILLVWLLFMAIHQLMMYLQISGVLFKYPHLLGISFPFPVLQGLMLFVYVSEITGNRFKHRGYILLHLLPAFSLVALAMPFYLLPPEEKIWVFENEGKGFEWYMTYINVLIGASGFFYSVWSLFLIRRYRTDIQETLSNTDKKELKWLQYLSIALGIIWILSLFVDNSIIYPAVVVFVILIGFFGINQMDIFNSTVNQTHLAERSGVETTNAEKLNSNRYAKSGLDKEKALKLYLDLKQIMEEKEIYKNANLTLRDLALELDCSANYLSQVINEKEKINFYSYVNKLRIEFFLQQMDLPQNKKYTMMSVANDCGFSNKSTFNRHFKRITGQTPSEFFKLRKNPVEKSD
ncbi:helix-turn-helix domain-containing protein [Lutimonas sp.]|uniref:helix-turn-helix domain-containing protein n=1 Tax=Lutimonas sp. TaxID=1872403 RepID=UPI003D9B93C4